MNNFLSFLRQPGVFCTMIIFLLTAFLPCIALADLAINISEDPSTVTITKGNGTVHSSPIYVGDTLTQVFGADSTITGTDSSGNECGVDNLTWSVADSSTALSTDGGTTFNAASASKLSISGSNPFQLSVTFNATGYWKVYVKIKAHFHSNCGDQSQGGWQDAYSTYNFYFACQVGDFSFSVDPTTLYINQGESAPTSASLFSLNGFAGTISFDVTGISGISGSGSASLSPNSTNSTQIMVGVAGTVPVSDKIPYPAFVTGTVSGQPGLFLHHGQLLSVYVTKRAAIVTSGFGTTNKNDGNGKPVANDPLSQVDTIIDIAKIPFDNRVGYIREKIGGYACKVTGFQPGFTYTWQIVGMGIDAFKSTTEWSAESSSNQKVSIAHSSDSDAYPQSVSVSCNVREADTTHPITSNSIAINFHWRYENLKATGLPPTPDPKYAGLEPVLSSEITSSTLPDSNKNPTGYVGPNDDITYIVKAVNPAVAWFYDGLEKESNFTELAALSGNEEIAVAIAAGGLVLPPAPKDYTATVSDSEADLWTAVQDTYNDEHTPPLAPGACQFDPPSDADMGMAAHADPDSRKFGDFQDRFVHTLKIKHHVNLYHYKGDQYDATGFLGTKPTDVSQDDKVDKAVNYYKDVLF